MGFYERLTELRPVTNTLTMCLRTIGKTLDNINVYGVIGEGKFRHDNISLVKSMPDDFHRETIEKTLSSHRCYVQMVNIQN